MFYSFLGGLDYEKKNLFCLRCLCLDKDFTWSNFSPLYFSERNFKTPSSASSYYQSAGRAWYHVYRCKNWIFFRSLLWLPERITCFFIKHYFCINYPLAITLAIPTLQLYHCLHQKTQIAKNEAKFLFPLFTFFLNKN